MGDGSGGLLRSGGVSRLGDGEGWASPPETAGCSGAMCPQTEGSLRHLLTGARVVSVLSAD